jgi:WWE domain
VRYYKGPRDPERTPYETLEEAVDGEKMRESIQASDGTPIESAATTTQPEDDGNSVSSVLVIWQFEDDKHDWVNYQEAHQVQIEQAYLRDPNGFTTIDHFPWTYVIDFGINTQTNLDHPDKTTRKVRRIHMDHNGDDHSQSHRRGSHPASHDGSHEGS